MPQPRELSPAAPYVVDAFHCCVIDCDNPVGAVVTGDDETGYTLEWAGGYLVVDDAYCVEHHHRAIAHAAGMES